MYAVDRRTGVECVVLLLVAAFLCAGLGLWSALRLPWYASISYASEDVPTPARWPIQNGTDQWPPPEWASKYRIADRTILYVGARRLADTDGDNRPDHQLASWRQELYQFGWPMTSFRASLVWATETKNGVITGESKNDCIGLSWLGPQRAIPARVVPIGFAVNTLVVFAMLGIVRILAGWAVRWASSRGRQVIGRAG